MMTVEDVHELVALEFWFARTVSTFPVRAVSEMLASARRGDEKGVTKWRDRAAAWRDDVAHVHELAARSQLSEEERICLLRKLRKLQQRYDPSSRVGRKRR